MLISMKELPKGAYLGELASQRCSFVVASHLSQLLLRRHVPHFLFSRILQLRRSII